MMQESTNCKFLDFTHWKLDLKLFFHIHISGKKIRYKQLSCGGLSSLSLSEQDMMNYYVVSLKYC